MHCNRCCTGEACLAPSVPVPTFVSLCSSLSYERRNQRDTSKLYDSSVALDLTFLRIVCGNGCRNFKSAALPKDAVPSSASLLRGNRVTCEGAMDRVATDDGADRRM